MVQKRFRELARGLDIEVKLVVNEQKALQGRTHARGRERRRAYACTDGYTVWMRPKLLEASPERVDGVLMHELAHCWCIQHGHAEHSERECDAVARELFGVTLRYDEDDVQTTGDGGPRPAYLPNPGGDMVPKCPKCGTPARVAHVERAKVRVEVDPQGNLGRIVGLSKGRHAVKAYECRGRHVWPVDDVAESEEEED